MIRARFRLGLDKTIHTIPYKFADFDPKCGDIIKAGVKVMVKVRVRMMVTL
jgi:hypothetical protein